MLNSKCKINVVETHDMNLSRSNYFNYPLQWREESLIKVEVKRNKKTFQSLIMVVHSKEGLQHDNLPPSSRNTSSRGEHAFIGPPPANALLN